MNDKVRRFIEENRLINNGDRVIVALSGGADSVSLLHLLISEKEKYNIDIYAAHFNHGIRGAEADRDESFVAELCDSLKVKLFSEKADVPAAAAESGESIELCGRRLRYDFLQKSAVSLGGALIATAHHRGDNAETVLWNLTRGAGLDGLSGIPAKRDNIIRPLLCCSRAEIEAYCADNSLSYVTDSTNLDDDYTRNKLRHRVMPVLRELNEGAEENIARTSKLMREADIYLDKISIKELNDAKTEYGHSCEKLLKLDTAVLKYAVKNLLKLSSAPVDHRHTELIIEVMRSGGAVELGGGYTAVCAQGTLRINRGSDTEKDHLSLDSFIKERGYVYHVRSGVPIPERADAPKIVSDDRKINKLLLNNCIPCDIITSDTVLRYRMAGDTFTDARRSVTKTLKKLMNELKIPRELRDSIPLIARGSVVLWLSGSGASAQAQVDLSREGDIILLTGDKDE